MRVSGHRLSVEQNAYFFPLVQVTVRLPGKLVCYIVFSAFCIMGTYLGYQIEGAIANTRAIGGVLGGILGGPGVGIAVGLTGGLHRYSLGGFTASACAVSTTVEGLIGGCLHLYSPPSPPSSSTPPDERSHYNADCRNGADADHSGDGTPRSGCAAGCLYCSTNGTDQFLRRRDVHAPDSRPAGDPEKYSVAFSAKALRIAERSVGVLMQGFNEQNCMRMASIIQEETGVGAVAITDCENSWVSLALARIIIYPARLSPPPHLPAPLPTMKWSMPMAQQCPTTARCRKTANWDPAWSSPLRGEGNRVFGTIKLSTNQNGNSSRP